MKTIIAILAYMWQLPQNIFGLVSLPLFKCIRKYNYYNNAQLFRFYATSWSFGVSLGMYVIMNSRLYGCDFYASSSSAVRHEHGHQKQSLYFGPLYLLIIGLPSAIGNLYDKIAHKSWSSSKREKWYYSQPWEAWADKLGNVKREI